MFWEKYSHDEIQSIVFSALKKNTDYRSEIILGLPGTNLDPEVFYDDAPFLKDAAFMSTLVANPNHIGCHTLDTKGEEIFSGTQEIERDLIDICAAQILSADKDTYDGYVASGGTEANLEAVWIYRNYFQKKYNAGISEIAVVYSQDSHYSIPKAANILNLKSIILPVNEDTRGIDFEKMSFLISEAKANGISYFVVVANMSTTMFGSVDDLDKMVNVLTLENVLYNIHIDAAFGGFIYPLTNPDNKFTFKNKHISSFTIDGHKMLQAPYGTGIFLIRKGMMEYVKTNEAKYVPGLDYTVCGSRSGANAVSVWMILRSYGSEGWGYKMRNLNDRTERICNKLSEMNIEFFRNHFINIIAIKSKYISDRIAKKYRLVANTYEEKPSWYKIVMMPHVKQGIVDQFIVDLKNEQ